MKTAHDLVLKAKQDIEEIDVNNAEAAIDAADLIIDVREPAEYDTGHITGAINIPRGLLEFAVGNHTQAKGAETNMVIYCKTSGRAALAAQSLKTLGYAQVQSIAGGFEAWAAAGKPVANAQDGLNFD